MKRCSRCKESFPPEGFHKGQRLCRACNAATVKEWRRANPEAAREQYRRNKQATRDRKKARISDPEPPVYPTTPTISDSEDL